MKRHWNIRWLIKKIDERGAIELKKVYNHFLDERTDIMKKAQLKVEEVFDDISNKDSLTAEHIYNLDIFSAKVIWRIILV